MPYIFSTATSGIKYTEFKKTKDMQIPVRHVHIQGGANLANKHLITPRGVATQVTQDDLEFLLAHPVFQRHVDKGYMQIEKTNKDPEKVIASNDMELKDGSAPETPETLAAKGAKVRADAKKK